MLLSNEQQKLLNQILEVLGGNLDITRTQYEAAVRSYQAVGRHLASSDSLLAPYNPEILPQGSFLLGLMIQPINPDDDLDIDLVCQLIGKRADWSQFNVKQKVGDQLKRNSTYLRLLESPDGRRCWTLKYREESNSTQEKYHMDILPAVVDHGYRIMLKRALSAFGREEVDKLAIRITDKLRDDYYSQDDHLYWLKSNPFGYAKWFQDIATIDLMKTQFLSASIEPVPEYSKEKLPLQRIIQILKRHRDIMFNGDEDKPISIIITTLGARAYEKESNVLEGLRNVIRRMPDFIEERYSVEHRRVIKWIGNPVNEQENFADKWPESPVKERNFYKWHREVVSFLDDLESHSNKGIHSLESALSPLFGETIVKKTFKDYGLAMRHQRDQGVLKMSSSGVLGAVSAKIPVKVHNFEGNSGVE